MRECITYLEHKLGRGIMEPQSALGAASMTTPSNNAALIKEAQAARMRAHIRAMLSKLKARTQKIVQLAA
jgi:hypothetical protein